MNSPRAARSAVLSFEGDDAADRTRIEIKFRDAGTKWLMLSYAHLEKV